MLCACCVAFSVSLAQVLLMFMLLLLLWLFCRFVISLLHKLFGPSSCECTEKTKVATTTVAEQDDERYAFIPTDVNTLHCLTSGALEYQMNEIELVAIRSVGVLVVFGSVWRRIENKMKNQISLELCQRAVVAVAAAGDANARFYLFCQRKCVSESMLFAPHTDLHGFLVSFYCAFRSACIWHLWLWEISTWSVTQCTTTSFRSSNALLLERISSWNAEKMSKFVRFFFLTFEFELNWRSGGSSIVSVWINRK